jgi:uridylate kinase
VRYSRVLVKLSGGALAGEKSWGFEPNAINHIVNEVMNLHSMGVEVGIVVGGGNIFRGEMGERWGIERAEADNIGMIATVINSMMLRGAFTSRGAADVRVMTAIPINSVAEPYIRLRAIRHLEHKCIVLLAAGTGNPYVTTDYPSVLRALELRAQVLLSAKNGTDGIYTGDPRKNPSARRYKTIHYDTVIQSDLKVMDQGAVLLARDHNLPIHVFDFNAPGAMQRICRGEDVGSLITHAENVFVE